MTYKPIPTKKRPGGKQDLVPTADADIHELLAELLIQQRLIVLHLAMITDEDIAEEDLL